MDTGITGITGAFGVSGTEGTEGGMGDSSSGMGAGGTGSSSDADAYGRGGYVRPAPPKGPKARIMAHEKEFVMNPRATQVFGPILRLMNRAVPPSSTDAVAKMMMIKFPKKG